MKTTTGQERDANACAQLFEMPAKALEAYTPAERRFLRLTQDVASSATWTRFGGRSRWPPF